MSSALAAISANLRALLRVYRGGPVDRGSARSLPRVAAVLGTQVLAGGRPSRTLAARTLHAARLYADGELDLVIPTGGVGRHPPSEAEVMYGILRRAGVPDEAVLLEDEARSTWESAVLVAGLARKRGIGTVRIVTDPLHCGRAVAAFRRVGFEVRAEPVYGSPMWRDPGLRLGQLAREMGASVWYAVRRRAG